MAKDGIVQEQLDVLLKKLEGKVVSKQLKKAALGELAPLEELVALSSLLTHALIEVKVNASYMVLVVSLHEQLAEMIAREIKREKT